MILISIGQNIEMKKFYKNNSPNIEKVYLMNYNSLLNYKIEEISSLINNNNEIKKYIEEINNPQNAYNPNYLEKIISKLDQNKLKAIDKEIKYIDFSKFNLGAKAENFLLINNKSIFLYREFIIISDRIFNEIKNKLYFIQFEIYFKF